MKVKTHVKAGYRQEFDVPRYTGSATGESRSR
jgi:hypothetical protein